MSGGVVLADIPMRISELDRFLTQLRTVDDDMFDLSTLRGVISGALGTEGPAAADKARDLAQCYENLSKDVPAQVGIGFQKLVEEIPSEWQGSASVAAQKTMSNFEVRLEFISKTLHRVSEALSTYARRVDDAIASDSSGRATLHTAQARANRLGYIDALTDGTRFDRELKLTAATAQRGIEDLKDALNQQKAAIEAAVKTLGQLREGVKLHDLSDVLPDQGTRVTNPDGSSVFVLPEQTVYGHVGPSQVGKHFPTADAAARAALQEIYGPSMDNNFEYAGNIYRNPDGSYSFSPPVTLGSPNESKPEDSPVPADAVVVGTYHSHAAGDPNTPGTGPSDELFSDDNDKPKATFGHRDSYLLTPQGHLYKYTPIDNLPPEERERFLRGKVTAL